MSKLKRHHINEVMDMHNLTKGELGYSYVYYADDVDKVIEEKDKEIADLEESHKMEVEQLLMEIVGLKKLVATADKLLKQKGDFTVKDIKFKGVKLEGFKKEGV